MRAIISFFVIFFLFSCNDTEQPSQKDPITAINYIVKFPIVQNETQTYDVGDTTPIYYNMDLIAYQLPYIYSQSKLIHDDTDTSSDELLFSETRYNYFVCKKGSKMGTWYESLGRLDSSKQIAVDSILKRLGTPEILLSSMISSNDTLIERNTLDNGNIVLEKYIPKTKPDETFNDTTFLYYSKEMNSIPFSLAES